MGRQRLFQEPDRLSHSLVQVGLIFTALDRCWNRRNRISQHNLVAQPTTPNRESWQHRCAGDLRQPERADGKASGLRKKRYIKGVMLIDAVSLDRHNLVAAQGR